MKKLCILLAALMLLPAALTACGGGGADETPGTDAATPTEIESVSETAADTEPETENTDPNEPTSEVNQVKSWGDNILISVPVWRNDWATSEHMKLLQDAGVDFVVTVSGVQTATFDTSDKLLAAARSVWPEGETGIRVMVHNTTMGEGLIGKNEAYIKKLLDKYIGNDAVAGYHIWDEPYNPTTLTSVERIIKGLDPDKIADINFLPAMAYGSYKEFEGRVDDYAKIMGDRASYISFDNYPFLPSGQVDESALFGNFEAMRRVSLRNDVPSAFYLQAVGSGTHGYMKATEGSLTYHTGAALAYGFKWIKYWSWYVPDYGNPAETYNDYTDSIMDKNGKPTAMYDVAKDLHAEVHAIGPTLINLEATEVYHTGRRSTGNAYELLPDKSFITPADNRVYSIVSVMTDRLTGENYLMVVNKDYEKPQELSYTLSGVDTVWEISRKNGEAVETKLTDNTLTVNLPAGGFALYRLPKGSYLNEKAPAENLLEDARVTASYSDTGSGWFIYNAFDGATLTTVDSSGYRYSGKEPATLVADLGASKSFNRLTLYPAGTNTDCGASYPAGIKLSISDDGETYRELLNAAPERPTAIVPSFALEETTARYIKLELTPGVTGKLEVAEIKLYNDGGKYTEETSNYREPVIVSGQNVALGKSVTASGSAYDLEGWGIPMVTDGSIMQTGVDGTNGWMSNGVKNRTDPTWVQIDLGTAYPINKIVAYPRQSGERFPTGFYFEVSTDGVNWKKVCEETADPYTLDPRAFVFETVSARYVRMTSTELNTDSYVDFAGGYMMQISEIEVYTE